MQARKFMHQCMTPSPPKTSQKSPTVRTASHANDRTHYSVNIYGHRPSLATASVAAAAARLVTSVSSRVSPVSSPTTPPSPTPTSTSVFGTLSVSRTPGKVKFMIRAAMATFAVGVYVVVLVLCQNVHGYPSLKVNCDMHDIYSPVSRSGRVVDEVRQMECSIFLQTLVMLCIEMVKKTFV